MYLYAKRLLVWLMSLVLAVTAVLSLMYAPGVVRADEGEDENRGIEITHNLFPDPVLYSHVCESRDENKDGFLSQEEISSSKSLDITEGYVNNLRGMDLFSNVWRITLYTEISNLDFSKFTNMDSLIINGGYSVESIDLSMNTKLERLTLRQCNISELDLSNLPSLERLTISELPLTSIDLSRNANLMYVTVNESEENPRYHNAFRSITLPESSSLFSLNLSRTAVSRLDLSDCSELRELIVEDIPMRSIDLSPCSALRYVDIKNSDIRSINLSGNPNLTILDVSHTNISSLDITHNAELRTLYMQMCPATSLNIMDNPCLMLTQSSAAREDVYEYENINVAEYTYSCDEFEYDEYTAYGWYRITANEGLQIITTPTPSPSPTPTTRPTVTPTSRPTARPTVRPTSRPTAVPTVRPTARPTTRPTSRPTATPTARPTARPTVRPTARPTAAPTGVPTAGPTARPTTRPTGSVTSAPTARPTQRPTGAPTVAPGSSPSISPSASPSAAPTAAPTAFPGQPDGGVEGFCERLYTRALDRAFDEAGRDYWVNELRHGMTGAAVAHGFFFSDELINSGISDEEFVHRLYLTFMDREPENSEMEYWMNEMDNKGMTREGAFGGFIHSTEWANVCVFYGILSGGMGVPTITVAPSEEVIAFATRLYTTCLGREADEAGLEWWASELANLRTTGSAAAQAYFFSDEFVNAGVDDREFVDRLYLTFMDRNAGDFEFDYWLGEMGNGMTRETVFGGFAGSEEFGNICAEYGIIR